MPYFEELTAFLSFYVRLRLKNIYAYDRWINSLSDFSQNLDLSLFHLCGA